MVFVLYSEKTGEGAAYGGRKKMGPVFELSSRMSEIGQSGGPTKMTLLHANAVNALWLLTKRETRNIEYLTKDADAAETAKRMKGKLPMPKCIV